jgi:hypothetical protein
MQLTPRPRYSAIQPSSAAIVRMAASTEVCTAPAIMRRRTTCQHTAPFACCTPHHTSADITNEAADLYKAMSSKMWHACCAAEAAPPGGRWLCWLPGRPGRLQPPACAEASAHRQSAAPPSDTLSLQVFIHARRHHSCECEDCPCSKFPT